MADSNVSRSLGLTCIGRRRTTYRRWVGRTTSNAAVRQTGLNGESLGDAEPRVCRAARSAMARSSSLIRGIAGRPSPVARSTAHARDAGGAGDRPGGALPAGSCDRSAPSAVSFFRARRPRRGAAPRRRRRPWRWWRSASRRPPRAPGGQLLRASTRRSLRINTQAAALPASSADAYIRAEVDAARVRCGAILAGTTSRPPPPADHHDDATTVTVDHHEHYRDPGATRSP